MTPKECPVKYRHTLKTFQEEICGHENNAHPRGK